MSRSLDDDVVIAAAFGNEVDLREGVGSVVGVVRHKVVLPELRRPSDLDLHAEGVTEEEHLNLES